jgi:hypothetical protein
MKNPPNLSKNKKATRRRTLVSGDQEQRLKRVDLRRIACCPTSVNDSKEEKLKMLDLGRNHEWKKVRPKTP